MSGGYPLLLMVEGRRCVVVGGGEVAARKVEGLLAAGAKVRVVAPTLCADLRALAAAGALELEERGYREGDLEGALLVIAATDDPGVNEQVWREAEGRGQVVNTVDEPARCNAYIPAVVRRGPLTLAVSTAGHSPAFAGRLRRELEGRYGAEYGDYVTLLGELRAILLDLTADPVIRKRAALQLADGELLDIVREQGLAAARRRGLELLERQLDEALTA